MTTERYVVSACKPVESQRDPHFPVDTVVVEAASRLDALRQARDFFVARRTPKDWTHIKIVDGPNGFE